MSRISQTSHIAIATIIAATIFAGTVQAGETLYVIGKTSRFDAVALNPQPLPPKEIGSAVRNYDAVMLNPQPLPPDPPPDKVFHFKRSVGLK